MAAHFFLQVELFIYFLKLYFLLHMLYITEIIHTIEIGKLLTMESMSISAVEIHQD